MLEWYKDSEIGIFFSIHPEVGILYPCTCLNEKEKNKICAKPFLNEKRVEVLLMNYILDESYFFTIPANYVWDGASIPRIFWLTIGAKTDP